jgi:hypothetical protein
MVPSLPTRGGFITSAEDYEDNFAIQRADWAHYKIGMHVEDIDTAAKPGDLDNRMVNADIGLLNSDIRIMDKEEVAQNLNILNLHSKAWITELDFKAFVFCIDMLPQSYIYNFKFEGSKVPETKILSRIQNLPEAKFSQLVQIG